MSHKKIILPISLGLFAMSAATLLGAKPISANATYSDDWGALNGQTITEENDGVKITNTSGFGSRAYYNEKILVDGLSFTWGVENLVDQECRGFAFHSEGDPWAYFSETGSSTFTAWQRIAGQTRFQIKANHDYNSANLNTNTMDDASAINGFSSASDLVLSRSQDFSLSFNFERIDDTWYKIHITGKDINMWRDVNYGVDDATNSIITYITKDNLHVDNDGKAYLITVGMDKKSDLGDGVFFKNMNFFSGIEATKLPTKTTYKHGEELDLAGLEVSKVFKLGNKESISLNDVSISGYDKNAYGKQSVNVAYKGFTTSFEVIVENPVTAIAISGEPKVSYNYGESLDLTTFKITRTYENGDVDEIPVTEEMVSGYDKNVVGKQNIAISTDGMMVEVEIDVKDVITGIAVKTLPTKVEYEIGEELDTTGGVIEVSYASGAKKVVDMKRIMVNGYDSSEAGEVTLDVEYEGFHSSFDITIKEAAVEPEPEPETNNNGCGGSVIAISGLLSLVALGGAALVTYKKKHH